MSGEYQDLMDLMEGNFEADKAGEYLTEFSVAVNGIGTIDADSVKGCIGNCYAGDCYALRTAQRFGWDFHKPKVRYFKDSEREKFMRQLQKASKDSKRKFGRIGVMGDPSLSWSNTVRVAELIKDAGLTPVVITKWRRIPSDEQLKKLKDLGTIIHSSICVLDGAVITKRLAQGVRYKRAGGKSLFRLITYETGKEADKAIQDKLLSFKALPCLETPLRMAKSNPLVQSGRVLNPNKPVKLTKRVCAAEPPNDCYNCKEQCGVDWRFGSTDEAEIEDLELLNFIEETDESDKGRFSIVKIKWDKTRRDEYHLFLSKKDSDKIDDVILDGDPQDFEKLSAVRAEPKDKKWMNYQGPVPDESELNPGAGTPASMEHLENGFYDVLEENGDSVMIEFNKDKAIEKALKGKWNLYRARPKSNLWLFKRV